MSVELVAFDLDGTILERGEQIRPECLMQIRRLSDQGVRCVINSGRGTDFQYDLLARLDLLGQFDALIGDERWIDLIEIDGGGYRRAPLESWNAEVAQRWIALEPEAERWCHRIDERARGRGWHPQLMSAEDSRRRGLWAIWFDDDSQARELLDWVEPQLAGGPLAANTNGGYIHVYDRRCDKGTALGVVADHFEVPAERVLAFGDNVNDRPMLDGRHGFASASVVNARADVQQWVRDAGGQVADRPSGLGVADILAKIGSGG